MEQEDWEEETPTECEFFFELLPELLPVILLIVMLQMMNLFAFVVEWMVR